MSYLAEGDKLDVQTKNADGSWAVKRGDKNYRLVVSSFEEAVAPAAAPAAAAPAAAAPAAAAPQAEAKKADVKAGEKKSSPVLDNVLGKAREQVAASPESLAALWDQYDADKSGTLDVKETLALMRDIVDSSEKASLADIKKQKEELAADPSGMGGLMLGAIGAMEALVVKMIAQSRAKINDESAGKLLKKFDSNGDGRVTKDEFLAQANDLLFKDEPLLEAPTPEEAAALQAQSEKAQQEMMQAAMAGMMMALAGGAAGEGGSGGEVSCASQ